MARVLIIGAGGVGGVVTHKCAQAGDIFSDILLATRTESRARDIVRQIDESFASGHPAYRGPKPRLATASVDAENVPALAATIRGFRPDLVVNVALPYQDLPIMDACLETGVPYLDTANYEPKDTAKFEYKWQWAYHDRFREKGLMALLGSGFDPGVTNVFCAYLQKHYLDEIHTVDIIDANAGDHGYPFATNFNPEINIREVTAKGRYWENGEWKETDPLSVKRAFAFPHPEVGTRNIYLMYHEELESLVVNLRGLKRIRFWMTFSDNYLKHLEVLGNVGMTRIDPVPFQGTEIVPLQFLKALLPDPASLGPRTKGKTVIGCVCSGVKNGVPKRYYIYNICDHQECYREVRSQAISYTTGVPAMVGATMMVKGLWKGAGVFNIEQLDPDPFLSELAIRGLPWQVDELAADPMA